MGMEIWILLAVVVVAGIWVASIYNGLVALRNRFKNGFAQIDVQLKRRYDLIPNLVETCKGYMKHERETLEAVIKARNSAVGAGAGGEREPGQSGGDAGARPGRRRADRRARPDVRAGGDRIPISRPTRTCWRCRKNSPAPKTRSRSRARPITIRSWNTTSSASPSRKHIFAGMFGFSPAELLQATESAEERKAPQVKF